MQTINLFHLTYLDEEERKRKKKENGGVAVTTFQHCRELFLKSLRLWQKGNPDRKGGIGGTKMEKEREEYRN